MWVDGKGGPAPIPNKDRRLPMTDAHDVGGFGSLIAKTYAGLKLKINRGAGNLLSPRSFFALYPAEEALDDWEQEVTSYNIWMLIGKPTRTFVPNRCALYNGYTSS